MNAPMKALRRDRHDRTLWLVALLVTLALIAQQANASGDLSKVRNTLWETECGSCHIAYPPALLPASAWRRMMATLDRHFGTDASLDARSAGEIGAFLEQHAGRQRRTSQNPAELLRITQTAWFAREHREVPADTWRHPAVRTAVNCSACHTGAAQGDFRERNIRMPKRPVTP